MIMMKKIFFGIPFFLVFLALILTGCGGSGPGTSVSGISVSGHVEGGLYPVIGAGVSLFHYQGGSSTLVGSGATDASGAYTIVSAALSSVGFYYIVAAGGSTNGQGVPSGAVLLAVVDNNNSASTVVNEFSTVALDLALEDAAPSGARVNIAPSIFSPSTGFNFPAGSNITGISSSVKTLYSAMFNNSSTGPGVSSSSVTAATQQNLVTAADGLAGCIQNSSNCASLGISGSSSSEDVFLSALQSANKNGSGVLPSGFMRVAPGFQIFAGSNGSTSTGIIVNTSSAPLLNGPILGTDTSMGLPVVAVKNSVPASACPNGGITVETGVDTDGDGVLGPSDSSTLKYVCNGLNGTGGHISLVDVTAEPSGSNCANGGKKISSGLDTNGDGILQPSEVTSTDYVCNGANGTSGANGTNGTNGANGLNTLTASAAEAPGANCTYGGLKISSGMDTDGDGILQPSEATSTDYVCNGANGTSGANGTNGTNGANGLNTLMTIVAEPAGSNCANGGLKISSGMDTDNNGVLEASEVTSINYACNGVNGTNGTNGTNGYNTLVTSVTEPAGSNCANGGYKISSGLDTDNDGVLQASEITSTDYACNGVNGTNGYNTLMTSVTEPSGSNCVNGGLKISSGLDTDNDGVLQASEFTGTNYVCNGATGSTGANGYSTLMATSAEAPGANCAYGGLKISSGLDTDGDGILQASEATSTNYVCNGAGVNWVDETGTFVQAVPNTGYMADNASQVTIILPASPSVGDIVQVTGAGAGGWKLAQNTGQSIITKNLPYTIGGSGVQTTAPNGDWRSVASSADGSHVVAVVEYIGIYTSADSGSTWMQETSGLPVHTEWVSVASSSDGSHLAAVAYGGGIYTSADSGQTWVQTSAPSANWWSIASSSDGAHLVAVVYGGGIYTSTDSGQTWIQTSAPSESWRSVASSAVGSHLVAGVYNGGIYTSADSGQTWVKTSAPTAGWISVASSSDGTHLAAVVYSGGIYTSTDSGSTWVLTSAPSTYWVSVASSSDGSHLAVVTNKNGMYTSADSGQTWIQSGPITNWSSVASSSDGTHLVASTSSGGIYTYAYSVPHTTTGTPGSLSGNQYDAIELQYIGAGFFTVISSEGDFSAQ